MHFAIIGAGMAGLACADALNAAGHSTELFDKGREAGGRMSTRRMASPLGQVAIDHGAQYFTARDPAFRRVVGGWHAGGVITPWPDISAEAWVGVPGMNAIIAHMAACHAVNWGVQITGMARTDWQWWLSSKGGARGPFDAAVLAIPAEQAAGLLSLHDFAMARIALMARSQPCWTSLFVFESPLAGVPPVIRDANHIAWAVRNNAKPGRSGPEAWVVQANADWSGARLELTPHDISPQLQLALAQVAGCALPEPVAAMSHRWRFALSAGTGHGALWNREIGLGVCGDWLLGPRIECAWLSGNLLAAHATGGSAAIDREAILLAPGQPGTFPKDHMDSGNVA